MAKLRRNLKNKIPSKAKRRLFMQINFPHQAELLRNVRTRELGLSQQELAEKAGVQGQNVSNVERGLAGISMPLARALYRLGVDWKRILEAEVADCAHGWKMRFLGTQQSK